MTLPNFLLLGKAKSGTTALYSALKQHPQVFVSPVKEPRFFAFEHDSPQFGGPNGKIYNREVIRDMLSYQNLFAHAREEKAVGEASPIYMHIDYAAQSAGNIHRHIPTARFVVILRQPAERAYSAFNFLRQLGVEPIQDFKTALALEDLPERKNWAPGFHYKRAGLCFQPLNAFLNRFSKTQLRVYLYEDWRDKPGEVLHDLCHFLEIDEVITPDMFKQRNVTWLIQNHWLDRILNTPNLVKHMTRLVIPQSVRKLVVDRINRINRSRPPKLDQDLWFELSQFFSEDIRRTQDLLQRDLTHWLNP
jgi:hypothetical protein